jgi:thiol-disulfide isomerase/thioredoxin
MKTTLALISSIFIILSSCDIVEEPYINPIVTPPDTETTVQKVLLEEFTGHQCPSCPAGAEAAQQLKDLYGNKFIIIAYHTGIFAYTSTSFPVDYTTTVGNELRTFFSVSGYPSGLTNRRNSYQVLGPTQWPTVVSEIMVEEPRLRLDIEKNYNSNSRLLNVAVEATALSELGSINTCIFLTESGLISPQKTITCESYPDGIISNYEHKHVFRRSLNGTWGSPIFEAGASAGDEDMVSVSCTLSSAWNAENMHIICFAYCTETGEIIQVEEVEIL